MVDASVNKFETTVLSALQLAQDELISDGRESSQRNEAFRELKMLLSSVSKTHSGGIRWQHKHVLLAAFPMLTSISKRWYKTFMRRIIPRCGVKNPWRVIVSENLSRDLLHMIQQIATRSSYGLPCTVQGSTLQWFLPGKRRCDVCFVRLWIVKSKKKNSLREQQVEKSDKFCLFCTPHSSGHSILCTAPS